MLTRTHAICSLLALAGLTLPLHAGPLVPPAGPVSPSMKTLAEVEARTPVVPGQPIGQGSGLYNFSQPGSYYLTGDIVVTDLDPAMNVFSITASDVTIDFNGFSVRDLRTSANVGTVSMSGPAARARLMNGSIVGGPDAAVLVRGGSIVENLQVTSTTSDLGARGIRAEGGSIIRGCTVTGYSYGISLNFGSSALDCTTRATLSAGIEAYTDSVVRGCVVSAPGNTGILLSQSLAESCSVSGGQTGISALGASVVRECTVRGASNFGISCSTTSVATGNFVFSSGTNYTVSAGSGAVVNSLAAQPATANLSR